MMRNGIETDPVHHTVNGVAVTVEVSPCSWMYPTYGLQLHFRLPSDKARPVAGRFVNLKKPWAEVTRADYDGLVQDTLAKLAAGGMQPCATCGTVTWNPVVFGPPKQTPRCDVCFTRELDKEFAQEEARAAARVRRKDRTMARQGFTHRVDAWVHPATGDDRAVSWYAKGRPTKQQIGSHLAALGSEVLDDYTVETMDYATVG